MRIQIALCIAYGAVGSITAQDKAKQPGPDTVLHSTTRLVQLNIIATRGDRAAADLKRQDFTITDNGKLQRIAVFSQNVSSSLPVGPTLPPNTFTNRLEQRAGTPANVTVILLDNLNTLWNDRVQARSQVMKFLSQIQPEDHIGIYTLGSSLKVLHDYTTDSTDLLKRLASYKGGEIPDLLPAQPLEGMDSGDVLLLDAWLRGDGATERERDFYTRNKVFSTLKALEFIAEHLARVPGRKSLIWVSGGFPLHIGFDGNSRWYDPNRLDSFDREIDHAARILNSANLAIYPIDARGLLAPGISASQSLSNQRPGFSGMGNLAASPENQAVMQDLAARTGGKAFYNTNDIGGAVATAVADSQVTYTVGYYPADEHFDGKFHNVDVKVGRSGVNLRYRKGYFDLPVQLEDEATRKKQLSDTVFSPLDSTEIGLTARLTPSDSKRGSYEVLLQVEAQGISLEKSHERWNGMLDVLFVQKDERGQLYNGRNDTITLRLTPEIYDNVTRKGLIYRQLIERAPRAIELRIVLRDAASGQMGSVTIPFKDLQF